MDVLVKIEGNEGNTVEGRGVADAKPEMKEEDGVEIKKEPADD